LQKEGSIVRVQNLNVWFRARTRFFDFWRSASRTFIKAVDGVSFDLNKGETLALVGESGSGKTTVARALMQLIRGAEGNIWFDGRNIVRTNRAERLRLRTQIQMIFQDPFDAMNPRETVLKIVAEPLNIHRKDLDAKRRVALVSKALRSVGLSPPEDFLNRYPHELSGGQRQRVLIAGALVLDPILLIADEPVSMLDASLKVEILNLLVELKRKRPLTYLLITHDLALTRYVADRIAIMYLGRILEIGPSQSVLASPLHPYTQALINVVPTLDRVWQQKQVLAGEIPHPSNIPLGCRFHPRCPEATGLCSKSQPAMKETEGQRLVACHLR